jgi:hypothetical protein
MANEVHAAQVGKLFFLSIFDKKALKIFQKPTRKNIPSLPAAKH